jgi:hypothetical protein
MSQATVRRIALVALAVYGLLLVVFRPATPFEWDELLFIRALDRYDVHAHAPHPPGYPVFVAAAQLVAQVTGTGGFAFQAVAILSAVVAVGLVGVLLRRWGADRAAAVAGAGTLAATPAFAFHANAGLSDVPAIAAALAAVWLGALAWERPRLAVAAGAAAAACLGIRPQMALVLVVPAAVLGLRLLRQKHLRELALAAGALVAVSAACWLPAILLTGPARFAEALAGQRGWIAFVDVNLALPRAPWGAALGAWLVRPFGSPWLAATAWTLVVIGAVRWWRAGRAALVAAAAASALLYLGVSAFTLNYTVAVRYGLPMLPVVAILAAGTVLPGTEGTRRPSPAIVAAWCVAALLWMAPVLQLRRQPAPVWSGLTWIAEHADPKVATVVLDGAFMPHAERILGPRGFRTVAMERAAAQTGAAGTLADALLVYPEAIDGSELLFARAWPEPRLAVLTPGRYAACTVARAAKAEAAVRERRASLGPAAAVAAVRVSGLAPAGGGWRLTGLATLVLPDDAVPVIARVVALDVPLLVDHAGHPGRRLAPGEPATFPLWPGRGGSAALRCAGTAECGVQALELSPLGPATSPALLAPAFVVPAAARVAGAMGSDWRTDLLVYNPSSRRLAVTARYLPSRRPNLEAGATRLDVGPGELLVAADVLARLELLERGATGAFHLESDDGTPFAAHSRTFNAAATAGGTSWGEGLPATAAATGLRPGGTATFRHLRADQAVRANLGAAGWAADEVAVRVAVRERGVVVEEQTMTLPPFSHVQLRLSSTLADGTAELTVVGAPDDAAVYPYVSLVDNASGAPTYQVPEIAGGPGGRLAAPPRAALR